MDETQIKKIQIDYDLLLSSLEELEIIYQHLLALLLEEKKTLVAAQIDQLQSLNQKKENLLIAIKKIEVEREKQAAKLGRTLGLKKSSPRLLELAGLLSPERSKIFKSFHQKLDTMVREVSDINRENEKYVLSALYILKGSMGEIKDTLTGQKTYHRKGQLKQGPDNSGHLVSREA